MNTARKKVVVAMSGGVDSSVAAALLLRQGYDVMGVFMRLGSPQGVTHDEIADAAACDTSGKSKQGCCSVLDAADARRVAGILGIPFYVLNFEADFGRVIDYFVSEYNRGRTPNPCVRCNDWLKFGKLAQYAEAVGADYVATMRGSVRIPTRGASACCAGSTTARTRATCSSASAPRRWTTRCFRSAAWRSTRCARSRRR